MNWRERLERFNAVLDAGVAAYKGFADALGSAMQKTRGQPYRNVDVLLCFALQGAFSSLPRIRTRCYRSLHSM